MHSVHLLVLLIFSSTKLNGIPIEVTNNTGENLGIGVNIAATEDTNSFRSNEEQDESGFWGWLPKFNFWGSDPSEHTETENKIDEENEENESTLYSLDNGRGIFYLEAGSSDQTVKFQNLIDQMREHNTIVLKSGDHYLSGTVHINKPNLIIVGEQGSIIRKSGGFSAIDIDKNSIKTRVENIEIDGGDLEEPCMRVFSSHNYILGSTFRNSGNSGLLLHQSSFNKIENSKMNNNHMVGLSQWESRSNQIVNCQMVGNGAEGITVDGNSHNANIHHNWIHRNNLKLRGVGGVGIDASSGVTIHHNTIDYNGYNGITFQNNLCGGCNNVTIHDNDSINFNVGAAVGIRYNDQPMNNFAMYGNSARFNLLGVELIIPTKAQCIPV